VILLCGIPSESPLAMVAEALNALGTHYRIVNQRQVADCAFAWQIEYLWQPTLARAATMQFLGSGSACSDPR
jgi:hypothetical protein